MHRIHPLIEGFCAACKPADRRPPWAWCEEHLTVDESSPFPGRWRAAHSPWVRAVMEAFADNDVRNLVVQCAAQTAKSQTALACLCWVIAEDPGHAMWVTSTRQEMVEFARDRLEPTFELCPPVRRAVLAHDAGRTAFVGMVLYHAWSGSKKRLQSKPIRWLFCDEVRNYAPGRLEMVLKRTRAYWNSRRFLLSTPGTKGDAMDRVYAEGNQQVWHFECPQCGQPRREHAADLVVEFAEAAECSGSGERAQGRVRWRQCSAEPAGTRGWVVPSRFPISLSDVDSPKAKRAPQGPQRSGAPADRSVSQSAVRW